MKVFECEKYKGKNVLVIGLGISGRAAACFLLRRGAFVVGIDRNPDLLTSTGNLEDLITAGLQVQHDSQPLIIDRFDFVVTSPGISPSHPQVAQAILSKVEVIGEIELACRSISQRCIGITGTNGKTTVTLQIAHILNFSGLKARALGNIGTPLTAALDQQPYDPDEVFVIELSSYQLDTLSTRFVDVGVILNITPDHLDRYGTMGAYAASKLHLYDCLKVNGKLFIEDKCYQSFPDLVAGRCLFLYGYQNNCYIYTDKKYVYSKDGLSFFLPNVFQGKTSHDVENMMATFAVCREFGVSVEAFLDAIKTFKKPPHRIEFVRTLNGVHYYDDSKGTNLDAVIRAVQSLDGKIVLIAGGIDKGAPYSVWLDSIAHQIKFICAIGKASQKIKADLGNHIPVELFPSLEDAVSYAAKISQVGDSVLLSPGCSSFDMFKDYAHRGEEFQRIVRAL